MINNDVGPDKLETLSKVEEVDENKAETLQRGRVIMKLASEETGHYSELGRRVHSNGTKRQCFVSESTENSFAVYNCKNTKVARLRRCPIYIS